MPGNNEHPGMPRFREEEKDGAMLDNNPLWYKDAVIYEVHVRAFHDSVGDGIGDFRGLTQKIDYLRDLGITAIWLLPFYPSPLKDDGYDIAEYTSIHPDYGTLEDFKAFLDAAHQSGLRVITELVINHTSDQHPWFQRARRAPPGSPERDFYVWSDTPEKYSDARIIFKDFELSNWAWDPVAKAYYWHRFYSHQPDLNYDNPAVWQAIFPVVDFWLEMGVDGMRLDAVPYLYEREGTSCENLPETHLFLKALRKHIDDRYANRMLLAEANQWPEDAVAYFGQGDESHMNFHFPLMPRMFMAVHMEDRFPVLDIMAQTPAIPETCQWALFLRNHDELTLEMVTDEERDYMYRAYATDRQARINLGIRRRLAPLLGNNRRRIELMNGLLLSLPGTPVLYYGDEIGMGDNIYLGDRNSVRTPMQWSGDRNAGFSRANPQKLYYPVVIDPEYHYESVNVEAEQNNPHSLLWWTKRIIALRKRYKAFGRGTLEFLYPENGKILAFLRRYQDETILVVANLSRFVQYVELDLSAFEGQVPVEVFGRNHFPAITKAPYLLTLGPHAFYWFAVETQTHGVLAERRVAIEEPFSDLLVDAGWQELFSPSGQRRLEEVLPRFLTQRRWFLSRKRPIKGATFREIYPLTSVPNAYFTLVAVEVQDGDTTLYSLPLVFASGEAAASYEENVPHAVVARVHGAASGIILDALVEPSFCKAILHAIAINRTGESTRGTLLAAQAFPGLGAVLAAAGAALPVTISKADQANTSVIYGNRLILKVFRRVEEGINPEVELGTYLTECDFPNAAPTLGVIEFRRKRRAEPVTLALLQSYVPNHGDAWHYTLDQISRFFEEVLTRREVSAEPVQIPPLLPLLTLIQEEAMPAPVGQMIGAYVEMAHLLGQRTAELHGVLAQPTSNPAFAPEPFTPHYQRSLYQSLRNVIGRVFEALRTHRKRIPREVHELVRLLLQQEEHLLQRERSLIDMRLTGLRTRYHGDYHLRQVLYTGKDFVLIDLEGEVDCALSERRLKRSPLRDVASMIHSFRRAAASALNGNGNMQGGGAGIVRSEDREFLKAWAQVWYRWVAATFVRGYLSKASGAAYMPRSHSEFELLLMSYLLDRSLLELSETLEQNPEKIELPLRATLEAAGVTINPL